MVGDCNSRGVSQAQKPITVALSRIASKGSVNNNPVRAKPTSKDARKFRRDRKIPSMKRTVKNKMTPLTVPKRPQ